MLAIIGSIGRLVQEVIVQPPKLGEFRDDASGKSFALGSEVGLRVKPLTLTPPEVPSFGVLVASALSTGDYVVERVDRVPSGQILHSSSVISSPSRTALIEKLSAVDFSAKGSLPDLATLLAG